MDISIPNKKAKSTHIFQFLYLMNKKSFFVKKYLYRCLHK